MSEQEKPRVEIHITVAVDEIPVIKSSVSKEIYVNERDSLTEFFLKNIAERLANKKAIGEAINKAQQDIIGETTVH